MKKVALKDTEIISFKTDSTTLNETLGGDGIETNNLVVLQAPTGEGKTTFMMRLAINASQQGHKVAYISLGEQSEEELQIRFICMIRAIKYRGVKAKHYTESQQSWINEAFDDDSCKDILNNIDTYYDENLSNKTLDDIIAKGYKFIFIDYLGCLLGPDQESQYSYLTRVSSYLKNLATSKDLCIVTAMQTNRALLGALNEMELNPMSIDETFMADSIGPARKATICLSLFTYRNCKYLVVFKNRLNGTKACIKLQIDPKSYEWIEYFNPEAGF